MDLRPQLQQDFAEATEETLRARREELEQAEAGAETVEKGLAALGEGLVLAQKIRTARRFHHGLANRCNADCNRGASRSSAACEYEMNPS